MTSSEMETSSSLEQRQHDESQEDDDGRAEEIVITTSDIVGGEGDGHGGGGITVTVDSASGEVIHHHHHHSEDHQEVEVGDHQDQDQDGNDINMDLGDIFTVSQHLEGSEGQHTVTSLEGEGEEEMLMMTTKGNSNKVGESGGGNKSSGGVLPPIPFSFPGQTFDTKCQKLILNVWDFFKKVKKNPDILDEIRTPQERAAAALHISAATIGKIGKNLKRTGKLETPGKKRKRSRPIVDSVKSSDEDVIKNIILEFRNNKIVPTLPMVLAEARQRIQFSGGATSFRRVLQRMGFKNLSQKNVVRKTDGSPGGTPTTTLVTTGGSNIVQHPGGGLTTLKVIKKELIDDSQSTSIAATSQQHLLTNNATTTYIQLNKPLVTYAAAAPGGGSPQIISVSPQKVQQQQGTILGSASGSVLSNSNNTISFVSATAPTPNSLQGNTANSNSNLSSGGNQIIQITTNQQQSSVNSAANSGNVQLTGNNVPIQLTQENAAALANAVQLNGGPQTFHILGADNTLRPIQIVYASASSIQ